MPNTLVEFFFRPPLCKMKLYMILANANASPTEPNSAGLTPLKAAAMQADESFVSVLLRNGAVVDDELLRFAKKCYSHKPAVIASLETVAIPTHLVEGTHQKWGGCKHVIKHRGSNP